MDRSQRVYKQKKRKSGEWGQHRGDRTAQSDRYRKKYPDRIRAERTLHYALQRGEIRKPECCQICLRKTELQAHHEDYDKPLDVIWVCWLCHNGIHMNEVGVE